MKKFEFGLFALCALLGGYMGSLFGTAIAICAFMTITGLVEELLQNKKRRKVVDFVKKEDRKKCLK